MAVKTKNMTINSLNKVEMEKQEKIIVTTNKARVVLSMPEGKITITHPKRDEQQVKDKQGEGLIAYWREGKLIIGINEELWDKIRKD